MNFIEKLQNKPHYVRVQILWISVILVMFIIIFFWITSLKFSLESSHEPEKQEAQVFPSLFGTIREDFSILKKSLRAGVKSIMKNPEEKNKFEVEILKPEK